MVALALSSSLLEQKKEEERQYQTKTGTSHTSVTQDLKWRPDAGICVFQKAGRGEKIIKIDKTRVPNSNLLLQQFLVPASYSVTPQKRAAPETEMPALSKVTGLKAQSTEEIKHIYIY